MTSSPEAALPAELARRLRDLWDLEAEPASARDFISLRRGRVPEVENLFSDESTAHEVNAGRRRGHTHCAMDAFLLPFLLRDSVMLRSTSPESGTVIVARISSGGLAISHPGAVMSFGVATEDDGAAQVTMFINLFPSEAEYERWSAVHPEAITIAVPVQEAFRLARHWSRAEGHSP